MCNPSKKCTTVQIFQNKEDLLKDVCAEQVCLPPKETADWALSNPSPEDTKVQTAEEEVNRLMDLKKYSICGVKGEPSIDRLTSIAASMFNTPISVVSLVDLRRLWFLSTQGLGDLREIPRADTLCSHCICNTNDILVIPDCTKDERFKTLFTVVGEPHLRFYAGACMKSPDGYNLGNFCILDTKPHPEGLTEVEKKVLVDFAAVTVKLIVDRHYKMEMEEKKSQLIAQTSHDLLTPLSGLQLSLSMLNDDPELKPKMNEEHKELINTASSCADLMNRICTCTIESLRKDPAASSDKKPKGQMSSLSLLVQNLNQIASKIPKQVPVSIQIDKSAQGALLHDDLQVFRVALNYLSIACARTFRGSVNLKIFARDQDLVFECQDCAPALSTSDKENVFNSKNEKKLDDSNLNGFQFVKPLVCATGGSVGFYPRPKDAGTVFWFSVPFPKEKEKNSQKQILLLQMPKMLAQSKRSTAETSDEVGTRSPFANKRRRLSNSNLDLLGRSLSSQASRTIRMSNSNVGFESRSLSSQNLRRNSFQGSWVEPVARIRRRTSNAQSAYATDIKPPGFMNAPAPTAPSVAKQRKKKALVIDDSLVIRKTLGRSLSKIGFEVELAEDGLQGLEKMKEQMFDFVMCDFMMPVMDGLDCVKQYRDWEATNRPEFHQYILGISAHANEADLRQGIESGMDKYVTKPIPFKMLKEMPTWEPIEVASKYLDEELASSCPAQVKGEVENIMERENDTVISNDSSREPVPSFAATTRTMEQRIERLESVIAGLVRAVNPMPLQAASALERKDSFSNLSRYSTSSLEKTAVRPFHQQSGVSNSPKFKGPLFGNMGSRKKTFPSKITQKPSYCLIAASDDRSKTSATVGALESNGWICTIARGSQETLQLLKMRQWDAVIVSEDLGPISATRTIEFFRVWEREGHRIHRQNNIMFECSSFDDDKEDEDDLVMQAPFGFDGTVRQHSLWRDLSRHISSSNECVTSLRTESSSHNFSIFTR